MKRRILAGVVAFVIGLGLFACGKGEDTSSDLPVSTSTIVSEPSSEPSSEPEPESEPSSEPVSDPEPVHEGALNPLTGLWGMSEEAEGKRPVSIMVNNLGKALPQLGIGDADLLYEVVTEGGITRLMAVFADPDSVPLTGPVRSARHYYITMQEPLNSIFVHFGGSPAAYDYLSKYKVNDVDGMYVEAGVFYQDSWRKQNYGQEHSFFVESESIKKIAERKGYSLTGDIMPPFTFAEEEQTFAEKAEEVSVSFSSSYYSDFSYDPETELYSKKRNGYDHIDGNDNEILQYTNIVVMFTSITAYNGEAERREVSFAGGEGYYISKGTAKKIKWAKDGVEGNFTFTNEDGTEVLFNPGKSYIGIVGKEMKGSFTYQ